MGKRKTVGGLAIAGFAVWLVAGSKKQDHPAAVAAPCDVEVPEFVPVPDVEAAPVRTRRSWRRRAALTLTYTTLFFAGAALTAGAGNEVAHVDAGSTDPAAVTDVGTTDATTDTTTTDTTTDTTETGTTTTAVDTTTTEETVTNAEVDPSNATPVTTTAAVATTEAAPVLPVATPSEDAVTPAAPAPAEAPAAAPTVRHAHTAVRHFSVVPANGPALAPTVPAAASPFPVIAFDPQAWLMDHPATPAGNAAVAIAERYVGVPYVWGGNQPSTGFDCSGLTQYVYAQLGVWLPHYAAAQFLAYPRLDPSQLQAGDLVFFEPKADGPGHVAIYAGNGQIVEAPHTGATVRVGSLAGAAASLGFLGAVRPTVGLLPVVRRLSDVVHATPDAAPGVPGALIR